jgi:hypothetical protein
VTPESKRPIWNLPSEIAEIAIQLMMAGELDDRWPGSRKRAGREESPDTETAQAVSLRPSGLRVKGNAPGNARGAVVAAAFRGGRCDGSRTVPQRIYRRRSDTR